MFVSGESEIFKVSHSISSFGPRVYIIGFILRQLWVVEIWELEQRTSSLLRNPRAHESILLSSARHWRSDNHKIVNTPRSGRSPRTMTLDVTDQPGWSTLGSEDECSGYGRGVPERASSGKSVVEWRDKNKREYARDQPRPSRSVSQSLIKRTVA